MDQSQVGSVKRTPASKKLMQEKKEKISWKRKMAPKKCTKVIDCHRCCIFRCISWFTIVSQWVIHIFLCKRIFEVFHLFLQHKSYNNMHLNLTLQRTSLMLKIHSERVNKNQICSSFWQSNFFVSHGTWTTTLQKLRVKREILFGKIWIENIWEIVVSSEERFQ